MAMPDFSAFSEFAKIPDLRAEHDARMLEFQQRQAEVLEEIENMSRSQFVVNAEQGIASEYYSRLVNWIAKFDAGLDQQHEVGIRLVSFGQTITFRLLNMGYSDPFLISFKGETLDSGDPVELIQHVNQISILLMKTRRANPEEPKQTFGFHAIRNQSDE